MTFRKEIKQSESRIARAEQRLILQHAITRKLQGDTNPRYAAMAKELLLEISDGVAYMQKKHLELLRASTE